MKDVIDKTGVPLGPLKTKFYIKYYMRKAGNDSPKLKKEINNTLNELVKLLTLVKD